MWLTFNISATMMCKGVESTSALFVPMEQLHQLLKYEESMHFESLLNRVVADKSYRVILALADCPLPHVAFETIISESLPRSNTDKKVCK